MINLEDIGYYLFMQEQEQKDNDNDEEQKEDYSGKQTAYNRLTE